VSAAGVISNSMIKKNLPYKDSDLTPVVMIGLAPSVVLVAADAPYKDLKEFIAASRTGQGFHWATAGTGSTPHFVAGILQTKYGAKLDVVPYKSGSESITAVIGKQVEATSEASIVALPYITSGKLKALADTWTARISAYPQLSTATEQGFGDIRIAGYTLKQAHEVLLEAARKRLRDPEMSFVLKDFVKPLITVGGEVEKPGQFELRGRVGVLEAVAIAGGFKRSAKPSQLVLLRRFDNDRATARLIDAKELAKMPDPEHDIRLQPGDMILVPRNKLSYVEPYVPIASVFLLSPFAWGWAH